MEWCTALWMLSIGLAFTVAEERKCSVTKWKCCCEADTQGDDVILTCENLSAIGINGSIEPKHCKRVIPNILNITMSYIPVLSSEIFGKITFETYDVVHVTSSSVSSISNETFTKFKNLKQLDLQNNRLTHQSLLEGLYSIRSLPNITQLFIGGNNIGKLTNETFRYLNESKVTNIQLPACNIREVEEGTFKHITGLKKINLNDNDLTNVNFLYNNEYHCRITDIQLKNNNIRNIGHTDGNSANSCIHSLKSLSVSGNPLNSLASINNMKSLTNLFAKKIPCKGSIGIFPVLKLPKLKALIIGMNNVSCWDPNIFTELSSLKTLNVSRTNLAIVAGNITAMFYRLVKLQYLDLGGTGIKDLPENLFHKMTDLRNLILRDNNITTWPATTFSRLHNLSSLDLSGNNISHVIPQTLPRVRLKLDLSNNPFTCNCELVPFRIFTARNRHVTIGKSPHDYKCHAPLQWRGRDLDKFRPNYTDCNPFNPYVIAAIVICVSLVLLVVTVGIVKKCFAKRGRVRTAQSSLYESIPEEDTSHEY